MAHYHVVTRVANKAFLFGDAKRKGRILDFLRRSAEFSGVEVVTYALMDNHIHLCVRVPERRDTTEKSYWLCVNGRSVQLPANNQYQEMKLPFAEALMNALKADRFAQQFADTQIQVYDPITNPHKEQ